MKKQIKVIGKIFLSTLLLTTMSFSKTFTVSNVSEFREALEDSALNGESDTINLNKGIYKTTSDGIGSFEFADNEEYNLTIQSSNGLSNSDVILDGDNTNRVFNYVNENSQIFYLKNLTIQNGNANDFLEMGGGVKTNAEYSYVDNCVFFNNRASFHGGGIATEQSTKLIIDQTTFEKNTADSGYGGAALYATMITNSIFLKNNSGVYTDITQRYRIIVNSTFDSHGITAVWGYTKVINSIFSNNKNDFEARSDSYLYNNYINYAKIISNNEAVIKKDNMNTLAIGDIKYINNTLRLSSSSPAIDKGLDVFNDEFKKLLLEKEDLSPDNLSFSDNKILMAINSLYNDKDGNKRIVNNKIDLGAYEYNASINNDFESIPNDETEDTNQSEDEGKTSGKACFIATASYGSYLAPEVKLLRDFRDEYLLTNFIGTYLVEDIYYQYSPPVANYIAEHENLRMITRWILTPIVYSIKYPLILISLFFGLLLFRYRRKSNIKL